MGKKRSAIFRYITIEKSAALSIGIGKGDVFAWHPFVHQEKCRVETGNASANDVKMVFSIVRHFFCRVIQGIVIRGQLLCSSNKSCCVGDPKNKGQNDCKVR